jgi:hypothetical protein
MDSMTKALFEALVQLVLGDGVSFLLWTDSWLQGAQLADLMLDLVNIVPASAKKRHIIATTLVNHSWIQDVTGVLTVPVILQYLDIRQHHQEVQTNPNLPDKFLWRWEASGIYVAYLITLC